MMIDSFFRILALTRKELLEILKERRTRMALLVPPILQCLIFGYAATYDLQDVPYCLFDQDRSAASRELVSELDGTGIFHRVDDLDSEAEVKTAINEKRALLVIQIDHDFEHRLLSGDSTDVQVIADGRNSNTAGTAMTYVNAVAGSFNAQWRQEHGLGGPPLTVNTRAWYNPNLETRWNMIPALIGTLTMLQTLLLTAMSVAREREQGTFDQLLVTPFRPAEIMAGKALPPIMVGIFQATNILLVAQLWFHIPFAGSLLTLYAGLALFLMAAVGIGLMISSFSGTMQQAMLYTMVVMMPFMLLSGLATPISAMPQAAQYFTLINPLRYAITIAHRVYLEGTGLTGLWPQLWPLAVIGVLTLTAASWMFRRRLT